MAKASALVGISFYEGRWEEAQTVREVVPAGVLLPAPLHLKYGLLTIENVHHTCTNSVAHTYVLGHEKKRGIDSKEREEAKEMRVKG